MDRTLTAVFDGETLRPESALGLEPNHRYQITIHEAEIPDSSNAWDILDTLSGTIDGPKDWSEQHDHYLHGTPKHPVEG